MTQMYYSQIAQYMYNIIASKIESETQKIEETNDTSEKQKFSTEKAELERLLTIYEQLIEE